MIYSMTGYAARTSAVKGGTLHIELKSVNSRYLDVYFRVCDELRLAETALGELFATRLRRGKLECRVSFVAAVDSAQPLRLNADLLERLKSADSQIRSVLPLAAPLTVNDVLHWPGIFGDEALDVGALLPACLTLAGEALDEFTASRAREGEKLAGLERVVEKDVEGGAAEMDEVQALGYSQGQRDAHSEFLTPAALEACGPEDPRYAKGQRDEREAAAPLR